MNRPLKIEIFLPDGEPTGLRIAEIRNRHVVATCIPRAYLATIKQREALQVPGIYLLVGDSDEYAKPTVYFGEAENVWVRLSQHNEPNSEKDFWRYAIALTSNASQLTKTDVKYLEWLCYEKARIAKRCRVYNVTVPTRPHVQESTAATLYESFENIDLLVSTLMLNIFTPLSESEAAAAAAVWGVKSAELTQEELVFKVRMPGREAEAKGKYTSDGFVVFAGARCSKGMAPSYEQRKGSSARLREDMIDEVMLVDLGGYYELVEDCLFNTPSAASDIVLGRSSNGWTEWKLEDGRTLSDIYRKEAA